MGAKISRSRRVWERVRNEPGLKRNVVILCILLVLASVSGGIILSNARASWPWESQYWFAATFQNAPAISPGNGQEVRIAGVKVGEIREASVSGDGKAVLRMSIDPKFKVYKNARLTLRPKSPLNEMYMEVNPGGPPSPQLPENGVLPVTSAQPPVQVDEVLGHLDDNTRKALQVLLAQSDAALANAPETLPNGLNATDQVAQRLQPVVQALDARKEKLRGLIHSLSVISTTAGKNDQRLTDLAAHLQDTLGTVGNGSKSLDVSIQQLPELTGRLRTAMDSTQRLSDQLDPALNNLRAASGSLPGSLSKASGTVDQLGRTVDEARPVVNKAGPVVSDLRPLVEDLHAALPDLKSSTGRLNELTSYSLPHLTDLQAFVYNTRSAYSLKDANGGILRGQQEYAPQSVTGLTGLSKRFPQLFSGPQGSTPAPTPIPPR